METYVKSGPRKSSLGP